MRRPLLCVRNDPIDSLGIAPARFEGRGASVRVLDAYAAAGDADWPDPSEVAGLAVFGGSMNVDEIEGYPYLRRERAYVARAAAAGLPVLGICLGAQLLARALDAPVVRAPVIEIGFVPITLTEEGRVDPLLSAYRTGDLVFQWHTDTFHLPVGARPLATGAAVANQAYRVGERAWGVQFHPEVTADELEAWIGSEGDGFERKWGRTAGDLRSDIDRHLAGQQERATELLDRFADLAVDAPNGAPAGHAG